MEFETESVQFIRKGPGGSFSRTPTGSASFSGVHHRLEKRPGGHDHRFSSVNRIPTDTNSSNTIVFDDKPLNSLLPQHQFLLAFDPQFHRELVGLLVGLGSRTVHRRSFAPIEHAKLQPGLVDHLSHRTAQRVDLADDLPLGNPPNGGIAAHLRHSVAIHGQQCSASSQPRSCQGCLAASMARSDHDHIKLVSHTTHRTVSSSKSPFQPALA